MKRKTIEKLSFVFIIIIFIGFIYMSYEAFKIVAKRRIGTNDGIYENRVSSSSKMKTLAQISCKILHLQSSL
jgi:hypothetical protein